MAGDRPRLTRRVLWEGSVGSFGIDEVELPKAHEEHELIEVCEVPLSRALDMIACGELIDAKSVAALHHAARMSTAR